MYRIYFIFSILFFHIELKAQSHQVITKFTISTSKSETNYLQNNRTINRKDFQPNYMLGYRRIKNNNYFILGGSYFKNNTLAYLEDLPNGFKKINYNYKSVQLNFEIGKVFKISDKFEGNFGIAIPLAFKFQDNRKEVNNDTIQNIKFTSLTNNPNVFYVSTLLNAGVYYKLINKISIGVDINIGQSLYFIKGNQSVFINETNKVDVLNEYEISQLNSFSTFSYNIGLRYQLGKFK